MPLTVEVNFCSRMVKGRQVHKVQLCQTIDIKTGNRDWNHEIIKTKLRVMSSLWGAVCLKTKNVTGHCKLFVIY